MTVLTDQPWLTSRMDKGDVFGSCAQCGKSVREDLFLLDDAYCVYRGRCPHCNAVNLLDQSGDHGLRGYTSREMWTVLPTDHEVRMNQWEDDIPMRPCTCKECQKLAN